MQPLHPTTNGATSTRDCARAILEGVPPVMWFIRRHMRRHRVHGLSVPQFRMLVLVEQYPTACLSAAAEHLGCSLPGASRMISGLVAKGFVTRSESNKDRRQISLALSARGRAALQGARQMTQEIVSRELENLGTDRLSAVADVMRLLQSTFAAKAQGLCIENEPPARPARTARPRRLVATS